MEANEYLENLLAESYKRELDQEENVIRSLPFAAAALAVISTIMVVVRSYVPADAIGLYPMVVWALLIAFGISVGLALCFLFLAVAPTRLQYLSPSNELYSYVNDLRDYYTSLGTPLGKIEQQVIEDTRTFMIEQYTIGATHNQRVNVERSRVRTRAFATLIIALALAFATVVIILAHGAIKRGDNGTIACQGWD
jgi:hypothetical protein